MSLPSIPEREGLDERRAYGRRRLDAMVSSIGPILDLSRGGARVLATRRLSGVVSMKISSKKLEVTVEGRVAWTRRLGLRRHEIGLEFTNVDADSARRLTRIASDHAVMARHTA